MAPSTPDGPYFEDFTPDQRLAPAPAVTVGPGETAIYQAVCGDPLAISLSTPLAEAVTGQPGAVVNPALVLQFAIGQSTVATRKVVANLFYRGVRLLRTVRVGETLSTEVQVRGLREASARPDRPPRGLVLLGITTCTADGEPVLDFERCALVRRRHDTPTGHADELGDSDTALDFGPYAEVAPTDWDLRPLGPQQQWAPGEQRCEPLRDTVTAALELVRLTQNLAPPHRDVAEGSQGRRLVYGGHTIGLAQAGLLRLLPTAATVVGWHSCDHPAPVYEGDLLSVAATLDAAVPHGGGRLLAFNVTVEAEREDMGGRVRVLQWRPVVLAP